MEGALDQVDRITQPVDPFLSAPSLDLIFHASTWGAIHRVARVAEMEAMHGPNSMRGHSRKLDLLLLLLNVYTDSTGFQH